MAEEYQRPYVPARTYDTPYPLIDSDPHFSRVIRYARTSDWATGAGLAVAAPSLLLLYERVAPSFVGKGGFAPILRLNVALGAAAGFLMLCQRSSYRFYGRRENVREQEKDMRDMVDKVKKGEPLYGVSTLSPYMQGVASRNSRYTGAWLYVIPWFNFVNHEQHGVDTSKYYQQAERELEAERSKVA